MIPSFRKKSSDSEIFQLTELLFGSVLRSLHWEKNVQCHCSSHAASSLVTLGRTFLEAVSSGKKKKTTKKLLGGRESLLTTNNTMPCVQPYPNGSHQERGRALG